MKLETALIFIVLLISYLYFSYVMVYSFIGLKNLKSPSGIGSFEIVNNQDGPALKYVALGDSLSAGVGSTSIRETIVYQFASGLSKKSPKVIAVNIAKPGATSEDVINGQLPKAILEKPDYITLLIGVNDLHNKVSAADFRKRYQLIIEELQNNTDALVTIINLPYLGSNKLILPPWNYLLDYRTRQFNGIIASVAKEKGVELIDLYGGTYQNFSQDPNLYSQDLFHPSGEGYMIWSQIINAD